MNDPPELRAERLRTLVEVVRTGGFSRAAAALGRTQSSVSQAIAALEDDVGELLIVRDGRRTYPTEAGRVLVGHAARVLATLDEARQAMAALRHEASGPLRLGTSDTLALYLLPPVLDALHRRFPRIDLQLDNRPSPAIATRVARRDLDVGVVSLPLPTGIRVDGRGVEERIRTSVIGAYRDVAIVRPDHPIARRRNVSLDQLVAHPLVLLDRSTAARAHLDHALALRRLAPRIAMEVNSVEVIKRLVALGFGAAIVPEIAVRAEVALGELAAPPVTGLGRERRIGVVLPAPGPSTRAASAFVSLCDEMLRAAA